MPSVTRLVFAALALIIVAAPVAHADNCVGAKPRAVGKAEYAKSKCYQKALAIRDRVAFIAAVALALLLMFALPVQAASVRLGLSFDGASSTNAEPWGGDPSFTTMFVPDSNGAVGPDHVVVLVNGRYAVYQKSDGALLQESGLVGFWGDAGIDVYPPEKYFPFDPRVLYDAASQRWFASTVGSVVEPPWAYAPPTNILVAVSRTSDPTQGWTGFEIPGDPDGTTWADFPKLGINADGVFVAASMLFPVGFGPFLHVANDVLVIPKSDLLAPTATVANATLFLKQPFLGTTAVMGRHPQPVVDLDGGGQPETLLDGSTPPEQSPIKSYVSGLITAPSLGDRVAIPAASMSRPVPADQPGDKANLDVSFNTVFTGSVVKQNGTLWAVQMVFGAQYGNDAVRWFQIDPDSDTVLQTGVIEDPDLDLIYPSIAVNQFDEVVIGMTGSSETQYASAYAVAGQTLGGVMTFGHLTLLAAGLGDFQLDLVTCCSDTRNRFGDYSATVIDPNDPRTFWTFQEYVSGVDEWSVRAVQLFFAGCTAAPAPGCRLPVLGGKASLTIKDNADNTKDRLKWKWAKGSATVPTDFGDPTSTEGYFLCVYDAGSRVSAIELPPGQTCAGKPCWKTKSTGFSYKDKDLTPNGALSAMLKAGADEKALVKVTAKGSNLPTPNPTAFTEGPIVVQLQRADGAICFEADYRAPFKKNLDGTFVARAD